MYIGSLADQMSLLLFHRDDSLFAVYYGALGTADG